MQRIERIPRGLSALRPMVVRSLIRPVRVHSLVACSLVPKAVVGLDAGGVLFIVGVFFFLFCG